MANGWLCLAKWRATQRARVLLVYRPSNWGRGEVLEDQRVLGAPVGGAKPACMHVLQVRLPGAMLCGGGACWSIASPAIKLPGSVHQ